MQEILEFASGLRFPEGPVAMPDGTALVAEIERRTLSRVQPGGAVEVVAELGGGPNGVAIGPDGRAYVCNNGGLAFTQKDGLLTPAFAAADYTGGWVDVVDLRTGAVERLFEQHPQYKLSSPNDIVFDRHGGFWFTDLGKTHKGKAQHDRGAVYYADPKARTLKRAIFPMEGPNGIGLSPDGSTVYVAESTTGRIWAFDVAGPGEIRKHAKAQGWERGHMLWAPDYYCVLDSLAIDSDGNICVADIPTGGITVVSPQGKRIAQHAMPDMLTTNICFGGPDLRTAYITLSATGRLVTMQWPRPGLALEWLNK